MCVLTHTLCSLTQLNAVNGGSQWPGTPYARLVAPLHVYSSSDMRSHRVIITTFWLIRRYRAGAVLGLLSLSQIFIVPNTCKMTEPTDQQMESPLFIPAQLAWLQGIFANTGPPRSTVGLHVTQNTFLRHFIFYADGVMSEITDLSRRGGWILLASVHVCFNRACPDQVC